MTASKFPAKEPTLPTSAAGLLHLRPRPPCADLCIKLCFKKRLKILCWLCEAEILGKVIEKLWSLGSKSLLTFSLSPWYRNSSEVFVLRPQATKTTGSQGMKKKIEIAGHQSMQRLQVISKTIKIILKQSQPMTRCLNWCSSNLIWSHL